MLALGGVFVSVALIVGSITSLALSGGKTERRRLREVTRGPRASAMMLPDVLPLSSDPSADGWSDAAKLLPRSGKEMNRLRNRLARAGIRHPGAPVIYGFVELLAPVIAAGTAALLMQGPARWLAAAGAGILAYFAPGLIVDQRASKRRREIENGLPDALDLLVVCIEAGSGLDQAIMKTADELIIAYPILGEELRMLNVEIRAGKSRLDAFKNLAQRTKVDDVRALVAMLIQTDRFGTSIGQALRTHSEVSRSKRRQRAEEAAQKVGVKLVFPLVLFFFPALYVVVLGPAIIQFVQQFRR